MNPTLRYRPGLHRLAVVVAAWTLLMIVAGGMVTSQNAGDSVPDWPLSYGSLLPKMVGNVFWEHGHRLIGMALGILTFALAIAMLRTEVRPKVRKLAWLVFPAVCFQGAMGGLRVRLISSPTVQGWFFDNPTGENVESLRVGVAIFHTATAQAIFCLMVVIALVTSRRWIKAVKGSWDRGCDRCGYNLCGQDDGEVICPECGLSQSPVCQGHLISDQTRRLRAVGIATLAIIFVQLLLGALRRQSDGTIWFHAIGAGMVVLHVALLVRRALGAFSNVSLIAKPAILLLLLTSVQVVLGIGSWVLTNQAIVNSLHLPQIRGSAEAASAVLTAHLALGATLLALTVVITARSFHHLVVPTEGLQAADSATEGRLATA